MKRKRPDSSSDDHKQQNGNMGSPSEDNSSDSDFVIINKKAASKKTKNKGKLAYYIKCVLILLITWTAHSYFPICPDYLLIILLISY